MNQFDEIEKLWVEWRNVSFPKELTGEDVAGVCVISLDTFIAGCVDTFVDKKGSLDSTNFLILSRSKTDLETVVQNLEGNAKLYFERLLSLSNKVISFAQRQKT